ncbi:Crp/Fnr family transcriptional regulator [Pseudomaricurvus alkylphenolicus]|uniref:Crp/Fnr family transcriptional regulator n=1 Tax=Pseudomaricurvus alkylphenolicus TaxID=1306991 RepID=UPI001423C7AA|nr:Crp/Fnr family transcriptional regulator [Pseudomaricurvus alkylphenolicus]NIB38205.1 Crp/Fnr family transcriptional regulator [Pseudomaricurvus alkylphenolicus]
MTHSIEETALQAMQQRYHELVSFPQEDWDRLRPYLSVKVVDEKHCLQAIGKKSSKLYFLVDGMVRFYYITPEGKEYNKGFYGKNNTIFCLSSFILDEPSGFGIETLEPSVIVEASLAKVRAHIFHCPAWQRLHLYCCEKMLVHHERRETELLTMSAQQRFQRFVRNFPGYLDRIPQYHIASYLGITPVALSKFKHQWMEGKSTSLN